MANLLIRLRTSGDKVPRNVLFPPKVFDELSSHLSRGELSGFMWRAGLLLLALDDGGEALKAWAAGTLIVAVNKDEMAMKELADNMAEMSRMLTRTINSRGNSDCEDCLFYLLDEEIGQKQCFAGPDDPCRLLDKIMKAVKE